MDKREARAVLDRAFDRYRGMTRNELLAELEQVVTFEESGPSGVTYQLEFQVVWDHLPGGTLRVLGHVDDGGWRSFMPLCDDLLFQPDGTLVG